MHDAKLSPTEPGLPLEQDPRSIWNSIAPLSPKESTGNDAQVLVDSENLGSTLKPISTSEEPVFRRIRVLSAEEMEEVDSMPVPTIDVWIIDVEVPSILKNLMEIIRKSGFDSDDLKHLKRVRTLDGRKSVLLANATVPLEHLPSLPTGAGSPHIAKVPKRIATSQHQLARKNAIWPVGLNPHIAPEERIWSSEEIDWLKRGIDKAVEAAKVARDAGEVKL
ncbi:hypothetical protein FRC09_006598 [Ceratobasidium sp. 395]|nr:hypothetical protein FRC09_006598 [Ceratobasidium sp. 395]